MAASRGLSRFSFLLRESGSTKATWLAGALTGLGDAGEGFVEFGVDLVGFGAEEDPGEDGLVELLAHRDRRIRVGGVDVLEQIEGVTDALLDLGVLRLQLRLLADEGRLLGVEASLVGEEQVTVDGVGVVGIEQLGLVRLDRLGLDGDHLEPLVVGCLLPVEFGEHDLFDAFALIGVQLDRAVEFLDPLFDLGDRQGLALLADGVAASVADVVLVDSAGPGARVLHE